MQRQENNALRHNKETDHTKQPCRHLERQPAPQTANPAPREGADWRVAKPPQGAAVRFRLILEKTDVARIIGRNGMTASAIRSLAKAAGEKHGIKVIVHMLSHEEAAEQP